MIHELLLVDLITPCRRLVPMVLIVDSIDEGQQVVGTSSQRSASGHHRGSPRAESANLASQHWNRQPTQKYNHTQALISADFPALGAPSSSQARDAPPASLLSPRAAVGRAVMQSGESAASRCDALTTIPELLSRALEAQQFPPWLQLLATVRCDDGASAVWQRCVLNVGTGVTTYL